MASLSDKYKNNLPFDSSNVTTIISDYTALNNDVVFVNTASSALTVTLPASPTAGSKIKVLDVAANSQNNNITILGNSRNIGGASAYIINTPDSSAEFLFINNTKGWNVLNEYISTTKPQTPTSISAVDVGTGRSFNDGAATVSFTPSSSGDSALSYTVTSTPGSFSATGTSSPIVVSGLQSNTSYTFKVYASNAAGNSTESTASSSITATTVPQAPTLSSVTYGFEKLTASFTSNATGGKAITSLTTTPFGSSPVVGSSPVTLTSLTGGTSYAVTTTATNENGTSLPSNSISSTPFTATGGTITTSGGYRIHTFTTSQNFSLIGNSTNCDYLVVAGGGGGSTGGGGAGGLRSTVGTTGGGASIESALSLNAQSYTVTIGAGGTSTGSGTIGGNGSNSVFSSITSTGGGGGGPFPGAGASGGSGGGGGRIFGGSCSLSGGAGTSSQGFNGGAGTCGSNGEPGGGGGAGATGQEGNSTNGSGAGGSGVTTSISGTSTTYAGGGGGGQSGNRNGGIGGSGGGGNGERFDASAQPGTANRGGGGGGSPGGPFNGSGGSGIVIVRYLI
jgi:hypothetical protein